MHDSWLCAALDDLLRIVAWTGPVNTQDCLCAALDDLQWIVAWTGPVNTQDCLCAARDDLQRIIVTCAALYVIAMSDECLLCGIFYVAVSASV